LQAHVPSYDRAIEAWVPVERRYVAPDGASYILTNDPTLKNPHSFYLVNVKTRARRLIPSVTGPTGASGSWQVARYASEGVYLYSGGKRSVPGLWLMNPHTGAVRLIEGSHYWYTVAEGAAWAIEPPFGQPVKTHKIYRLDLGTRKVSKWYEIDAAVRLLSPGPDGDILIEYGEPESAHLARIAGPNQFVPIDVPPDFPYVDTAGTAYPGIWIAVPPGGLALLTYGEGLRMMIPPSMTAGGTDYPDLFDFSGDCQ
jgi:hypothetical protein